MKYKSSKIACPIRTKSINIAINHRQWITTTIKTFINKKNSLYKAYLKEQSTQSLQLYKAYRNKLTAILRKVEKEYYLTKFENVKDNLAKT